MLRRELAALANTRANVPAAKVLDALLVHEYLPAYSQDRALAFDCRIFRDPEHQRPRQGARSGGVAPPETEHHLGFHPDVQWGIVRDRQFPEFMNTVRTDLENLVRWHRDAQTGPARPIHVHLAFWCNHGRHRSVACLELVRHCLGYYPKIYVLDSHVTHLGHWQVGRTCHLCEVCRGVGMVPERQKVFDEAWRHWRWT